MVREFILVRRTSEFVSPKPEGTTILASARTLEEIGEFVDEKTGRNRPPVVADGGDHTGHDLGSTAEIDDAIESLLREVDDGPK